MRQLSRLSLTIYILYITVSTFQVEEVEVYQESNSWQFAARAPNLGR